MSNLQHVYLTGKDINVLESKRFIHSFFTPVSTTMSVGMVQELSRT